MSILAPADHPLAPPAGVPLPIDVVLDIAASLGRARSLWADLVRHDQATRHAVRLFVQDSYEAWVIGWPAGHRTTPHDHGGSVGALVVVEGQLVERTAGSTGVGRRRLHEGDAVALPSDVVHDVGTAPTGPATSIHVYSPPLSTMTFFEEGFGVPDHVLDVVDEAPVLDAATVSRALHPAGVPAMSESAIDRLLDESRRELDRVAPEDLAAEIAGGALVVDIRPAADRQRDGDLVDAVVIERIHLEWRLDPSSPHRIPEATPDRRVIVVCNEGYASSLAAATLRTLGHPRATDLAGGFGSLDRSHRVPRS